MAYFLFTAKFLDPFRVYIFRRAWFSLVVTLIFNFLTAATEGAVLFCIYQAVNVLSGPSDNVDHGFLSSIPVISLLDKNNLFLFVLWSAVFFQFLQACFSYISALAADRIVAFSVRETSRLLHEKLIQLKYPLFSSLKSGDLLDLFNRAPQSVAAIFDAYKQFIFNLFLFLSYLFVIISLSPYFVALAILLGYSVRLIHNIISPRLASLSSRLVQHQVELSVFNTQQISGVKFLHFTSSLRFSLNSLQGLLNYIYNTFIVRSYFLHFQQPFGLFLPLFLIVVSISFAISLDFFTPGELSPILVTFLISIQRLNVKLSSLVNIANRLTTYFPDYNRLLEFLNLQSAILPRAEVLDLSLDPASEAMGKNLGSAHLSPYIRFESVSLKYPSSDTFALREVSFNVFKGQYIAIVGPSGSGKSSVISLLTGLYLPTSGHVFIEDHEVLSSDCNQQNRFHGVVSQDPFFFDSTIFENLTYGQPHLGIDQVHEAARISLIHDFILSLPDGYHSMLGEHASLLSGGQRQRLALTRALLRSKQLILLDEATSALDMETEYLIQSSLQRLSHRHTFIVVAHRLSSITHADLIFVMDSGSIIEQGTHKQLLSNTSSLYHALWSYQISE